MSQTLIVIVMYENFKTSEISACECTVMVHAHTMLIHTLRLIVPRIKPVLATSSKHCNATRLSPNIRRTRAYAERTLYMDKEKHVLAVVRQRHSSKARIFNHQYAIRTLNMHVINCYLPH